MAKKPKKLSNVQYWGAYAVIAIGVSWVLLVIGDFLGAGW